MGRHGIAQCKEELYDQLNLNECVECFKCIVDRFCRRDVVDYRNEQNVDLPALILCERRSRELEEQLCVECAFRLRSITTLD